MNFGPNLADFTGKTIHADQGCHNHKADQQAVLDGCCCSVVLKDAAEYCLVRHEFSPICFVHFHFQSAGVKIRLLMDERLTEIPTATLIVAAALVGPDGQVLMQLRQKRAMHGGLWEFPGGKVEPGEPPEAALRREIHEELGLDISESELVPVGFAADQAPPVPGGRLHVILLYMVCRWVGEPASLDAQQIAWLSPRALSDLAMPPLDYPLAEQLLNFLPKN